MKEQYKESQATAKPSSENGPIVEHLAQLLAYIAFSLCVYDEGSEVVVIRLDLRSCKMRDVLRLFISWLISWLAIVLFAANSYGASPKKQLMLGI